MTNVSIPNLKEKDTVKTTNTDRELPVLLAKHPRDCDFCEYRNWVIVNYLLNSGCRAATIRNIQNRDVDLEGRQVMYLHTRIVKNQIDPLCTQIVINLMDKLKTEHLNDLANSFEYSMKIKMK